MKEWEGCAYSPKPSSLSIHREYFDEGLFLMIVALFALLGRLL